MYLQCGRNKLVFQDASSLYFVNAHEDVKTARGKKAKDRVTLVVCANTDGSNKVPCAMIGKSKTPASASVENGAFRALSRNMLG